MAKKECRIFLVCMYVCESERKIRSANNRHFACSCIHNTPILALSFLLSLSLSPCVTVCVLLLWLLLVLFLLLRLLRWWLLLSAARHFLPYDVFANRQFNVVREKRAQNKKWWLSNNNVFFSFVHSLVLLPLLVSLWMRIGVLTHTYTQTFASASFSIPIFFFFLFRLNALFASVLLLSERKPNTKANFFVNLCIPIICILSSDLR